MKKVLVLTLVLVFALSGLVFADNVAEVKQDGDEHYAYINQDGNGNAASANQTARITEQKSNRLGITIPLTPARVRTVIFLLIRGNKATITQLLKLKMLITIGITQKRMTLILHTLLKLVIATMLYRCSPRYIMALS